MPSHLNPKSRLTSSLFATTLFASFFVVALPHILPCPASKPVAFNDDGTMRRLPKQKRGDKSDGHEKYPTIEAEAVDLQLKNLEKRQCPMPKPRGLFETLFGFKSNSDGNSNSGENGIRPP